MLSVTKLQYFQVPSKESHIILSHIDALYVDSLEPCGALTHGNFDNTLFLALQQTFHISPVSESNSNHTQPLSVGYSSKRPGFLSSASGSALSTRGFCGFDGTTAWMVPSLVSSRRKTPIFSFLINHFEFSIHIALDAVCPTDSILFAQKVV